MRFLKILFWVFVGVFLGLLARRNWYDVTLNLWGDIQLDIKAPILLAAVFLLGFLPPFLILRARVWTLRRRIEMHQRQAVPAAVPAPVGEEVEVA